MKADRRLLVFTGLGFELVGLVLLAVFFGLKSEEWISSNGLLLTAFLFLALLIWLAHVLVMVRRLK